MQAEQPAKLFKPQRKMRVKVGPRKTGLTPAPSVIVTGRPKAVFSLRFHLFFCLVLFNF